MKRDDLGALLKLKRVREQLAAAVLERARGEVSAAVAEQDGAARALRAFGVLRQAQESTIYRRLAGEATVGAGRVLAATANLTDLAAREAALGQRLGETERQVRERKRLAEAARTEHQARQRRAESLDALSQRLLRAERAATELGSEREAEERIAPPDRRR